MADLNRSSRECVLLTLSGNWRAGRLSEQAPILKVPAGAVSHRLGEEADLLPRPQVTAYSPKMLPELAGVVLTQLPLFPAWYTQGL